jgi:hypothetical protein
MGKNYISRCSSSTSSAIWSDARRVPATFAAPKGRDGALKPLARYRIVVSRLYFRADAGFANPEV